MKAPSKRTAVIVLNWNKPEMTIECLESLQTMEGEYDIFVVDNGSDIDKRDKLIEEMKKKNAIILSEALETISLPSLAIQDFKAFEVIIWDASDDDKPKIVVEKFIQSHSDMMIRYYKAPRMGSASQRNDAVKVVAKTLNTVYSGCEIPIQGLKKKLKRSKLNYYAYAIASIIFRLNGGDNRRYFRLSSYTASENNLMQKMFKPKSEEPEWLMGCSMAYKREVFRAHSFDMEYCPNKKMVFRSKSNYKQTVGLKIIDS